MADDLLRSADIHADYEEAGFSGRLGMGERPAVVVVDMCLAYFEDGSPLHLDRPDVLEACRTLVEEARRNAVPVLWTRVEFAPGGADGGIFRRKVAALEVLEKGGHLGDWCPGLEPGEGEIVVTKQYASGFFGTSLASTLVAMGIDTTIVCGVSTSGCVRATTLDACQHGFIPIVAAEACGDRDPAIHDANLFDLDAKYADVESLATVIEALTSHASSR